jgi:hypothetical protein
MNRIIDRFANFQYIVRMNGLFISINKAVVVLSFALIAVGSLRQVESYLG